MIYNYINMLITVIFVTVKFIEYKNNIKNI